MKFQKQCNHPSFQEYHGRHDCISPIFSYKFSRDVFLAEKGISNLHTMPFVALMILKILRHALVCDGSRVLFATTAFDSVTPERKPEFVLASRYYICGSYGITTKSIVQVYLKKQKRSLKLVLLR